MRQAGVEPGDALKQVVLTSWLGGLGGDLVEAASGGRPLQDSIVRTLTPWRTLKTLHDLTLGRGPWKGRGLVENPIEAVKIAIEEIPPIGRDVSKGLFGLQAFALGTKDPRLDRAFASYYRWRRLHAPRTKIEVGASSEDKVLFRRHMRTVSDLLRRGVSADAPEVKEALTAAVGMKTRSRLQDVQTSIRNRRIFRGPDWQALTDEQKNKVRRYIGETGVRKIEAYDALLEEISSTRYLRRIWRDLPQEQRRDLRQQEREEKREKRAARRATRRAERQ